MSDNAFFSKTGTFCQLMSPVAAECLCHAGFDFLIADAEHSPLSDADLLHMIQATSRWPEKLFVRTKDASRATLLRALDLGPAGIIIPDVHHLEQICAIDHIIQACKAHLKIAMIFAADKPMATRYAQRGFD
ncbi:aldolase/citrate lyase family protein [Martelella alba]|uniref:HpcH/HpaI aldolase/citrate lyase domain-containing protein n=1 Tax=Martelella alba TaxID=2590451 RepID=A0ABY2SPN2_9HYPH|nr:aldolase/citrate lyase family protein [Martelella alba]TKI07198.1 hypothetical protein FCN80_07160 [Martelella alba]